MGKLKKKQTKEVGRRLRGDSVLTVGKWKVRTRDDIYPSDNLKLQEEKKVDEFKKHWKQM